MIQTAHNLIRWVCCLVCVSTVTAATIGGEHWPQFRGPHGNGTSDATGLPTEFGDRKNARWKTPIHGRAWSSPIVWGDQIWLTSAPEDGKATFAICVNLQTGEILRNLKLWNVAEPQYRHPFNSYASPTPVAEENRLYVHFGAHGTAAIDAQTGDILWSRRDLECNHFRGSGSSPIIVDNLLILTFDGFDVQYIVALDKHTGETVWQRDRNIDYGTDNGDFKKAYSTPHIVQWNGRRELVSPSAGATISYDPTTGEELWRVRCGGINAAVRPIFAHDMIYLTTAWQGWQLYALRLGGSGDITDSHVVWKFDRAVPQRSSPIVVDDLLFMISDAGVLTCVDAKSGKLVKQRRLGGKFSASPVAADGKIYFFDEDGNGTIVEASPDLNVLAKIALPDGVLASPAIVGNSLIVRTKSHLYRFQSDR